MKIKFDRKATASFGDCNDPLNTPQKLVNCRRSMLNTLGKFCGADIVTYNGYDKNEVYSITKGKKTLILEVHGNHCDGGWLNLRMAKDIKQNMEVL